MQRLKLLAVYVILFVLSHTLSACDPVAEERDRCIKNGDRWDAKTETCFSSTRPKGRW
ncbi:hypothetical protein [Leptolyngbya phage Lbo240-yong1]|uniref:Uncharacterized protein n=1 Tax=Leptolyngbya phage Lbo240-yong1 TaxID=2928836 RepID=A0A9X9E320_9CAUD|nr:hypothetical protein [Leptolyngbya phage Lbo240-yong1]